MKYFELTKEEERILADYDKGVFAPVSDSKGELKKHKEYAQFTLNKTRNVNLRLSERDLQKLKAKAVRQGIPYQTLAASILHQYSNV